MISDCIPSFYSFNVMDLKKLSVRIIGFDIYSPFTIIESNVFAFSNIEHKNDNADAKTEQVDLSLANPIKETAISGKSVNDAVAVKNATTYTFDVNELLNEPLSFKFEGNKPEILIIHSHTSEAYTSTDKNYYLPTDPDRTEDINYNVVRVGSEIAETLKKNGIESLHDISLHDYPSYNGSYKSALASVEKYLQEYPSIKMVLDIHRDAMVQPDGTKLKLVADINGEKAAQIMLLTGTNQGGLEHPNWRENLKFAVKLQKVINDMYPSLARPVSLTKERYNTHTTKGSLIVEIGTSGNTLEEALVSARLLGEAVSKFVKS